VRLWSLHPTYLDRQGLLACWREGLLARKVLLGQTKGYRNHPQLERFKSYVDPVKELDAFLQEIQAEAERRGYAFDRTKLGSAEGASKMLLTSGQLKYELEHLKGKLFKRDPGRYQALTGLILPDPNPVFEVIEGELETWERVHPK
jgi:hypothetical protein